MFINTYSEFNKKIKRRFKKNIFGRITPVGDSYRRADFKARKANRTRRTRSMYDNF